jgi:hypothetical protein
MAKDERILSRWEAAIEGEDAKDWGQVEFHALHEENHVEGHELISQQSFALVQVAISEDRRTVGLLVSPQEGDYYMADTRDSFSLWFSRADAQRIGQTLLKQAPGGMLTPGEGRMLLSPREWSLPVKAKPVEVEAAR